MDGSGSHGIKLEGHSEAHTGGRESFLVECILTVSRALPLALQTLLYV